MKFQQIKAILSLSVVFVAFSLATASADIYYLGDGNEHDFDGSTQFLTVESSSDFWNIYPTTVNLVDGGEVELRANIYHNSVLNIKGGRVNSTSSYDGSSVRMTGGTLGNATISENSRFLLSGGTVLGFLRSYARGDIEILGGIVQGGIENGYANNFYLSGGHIAGGCSLNSTTAQMLGGSIGGDVKIPRESQMILTGGTIGGKIHLSDNGRLFIHGRDFHIDGIPAENGIYTAHPGGTRRTGLLTGTLSNGDTLSSEISLMANAELHLVPEPATLALLSLGALITRKRAVF